VLARFLRNRPALTDAALQASMLATIEAARLRHALHEGTEATWKPGEALKLLLVGYLGTRNTGADVRTGEMLRQFRHVLGDEQCELTALTSDPRLSAGYFPGVRQVKLPDVFPPFLLTETAKHHGVVACEGSMFKSKFSNALTTLMAGALGLAAAQNKVAIGYGAEAGAMDPLLRKLVARTCRDALIVCRNEASRDVLAELDVPTAPGADTAWTFSPAPPEEGRALLTGLGWDGETPLLIACPINPFWWPVRPAVVKTAVQELTGVRAPTHYRSLYHHAYNGADEAKFNAYLDAWAEGISAFAAEERVQVVTLGMERLDRVACEGVAARLEPTLGKVPCLISDEHDMFTLVSALRHARYLISSRYHAIVCSMPGGVPALGVSMDERIENLLAERGEPELCLRVGAPGLGEQILDGLRSLRRDGERSRAAAFAALPAQLERMGRMGMSFEGEVLRRYPEFPKRDLGQDPWAYLPPLGADLQAVLAQEPERVAGQVTS
jgi:polysaccharide pyruvyl transferase WcaK-like protein